MRIKYCTSKFVATQLVVARFVQKVCLCCRARVCILAGHVCFLCSSCMGIFVFCGLYGLHVLLTLLLWVFLFATKCGTTNELKSQTFYRRCTCDLSCNDFGLEASNLYFVFSPFLFWGFYKFLFFFYLAFLVSFSH